MKHPTCRLSATFMDRFIQTHMIHIMVTHLLSPDVISKRFVMNGLNLKEFESEFRKCLFYTPKLHHAIFQKSVKACEVDPSQQFRGPSGHLSSARASSGVLSSDSSRLIWCPSGSTKSSSGNAWQFLTWTWRWWNCSHLSPIFFQTPR